MKILIDEKDVLDEEKPPIKKPDVVDSNIEKHVKTILQTVFKEFLVSSH